MGFLTGWDYRKKVTLNGQANAGTNYQVKLLVGESSGASGANFHVENHSNSFPSAKNISGDLRFTSSDETTILPFWVENVTGSSPNRIATVWVKVSADLGSNQDIYCYYKGTTTNVSSGTDTFDFFDDFDVSTLDSSKWTKGDYGTTNISNSELHLNYSATNVGTGFITKDKVAITTEANRGIQIMSRTRWSGSEENNINLVDNISTVNDGGVNGSDQLRLYHTSYNSVGRGIFGGGRYRSVSVTIGNYTTSADEIFKIGIVGTSVYYNSGAYSGNVTSSNTTASRTFWFSLCGGGSTYPFQYFNWVAVKKFLATEPSFNTVSGEELPSLSNASFLLLMV